MYSNYLLLLNICNHSIAFFIYYISETNTMQCPEKNLDKSNDWQEPLGRPWNMAGWHVGPESALFVQKVFSPRKIPILIIFI